MIDLRLDPFKFEFRPKTITGEIKTVRHFPAFNRVGFFLNETPQRVTSRPVSIICAGDTLSEVGRLTSPGVDNFRIDYGNVANFAQAGFVELNASRIGQIAVINYRGLGVNLNASLLDDATPNIERSVSTPANVTARGLSVTGSLSFIPPVLSAGMQRIRDLSSVSANDIISLSKFLGLTGRSAPRILTGSGYWQRPANVKKVFFVLIGPGGSGHIDGGGGGGGASVYGVADLESIGGDMFAYVCGVVGIATTIFGCVAGAGSSATGSTGAGGGTGAVGVDVVGVASTAGMGSNSFFIAVSSNGANRVMSSIDGVTWVARSAAETNQWAGVAYGGGRFAAIAQGGTNRIMTSADGITWTARAVAANQWTGVAFGNGGFAAVAYDGSNRVMTSADGESWAPQIAAEANGWRGVTYGNGLFVAVSEDGANRVMTSADGITWTARAAAEANLWWAVSYGNGIFVAVSVDGANRVMTSADGITWTARAAAEANGWRGVTYGNGLFVAVANSGTNRVMTSADGITWTARAAVNSGWQSITYGNGLFVAVADDGANRVMTSADGITWTARAAAEANIWKSVIFAPAGAGGSSGGGLGGNGNDADCGKPGKRKGFFSGSGGDATTPPESFGGGAGAGGTGADGLILLVY